MRESLSRWRNFMRAGAPENTMLMKTLVACSAIAVGLCLLMPQSASALSMAECSAKYNAAKDNDALGGKSWSEFRKLECGTDAGVAEKPEKAGKKSAKAAASDDDQAKGLTAKQCSAKFKAAKAANALDGMKWNDFRKAECGAGASIEFAAAASDEKTAEGSAATEEEEAKGLTSKQCSTKFQAAKAADALNGMKWNDFRKAECGPGATVEFAAVQRKVKAVKAEAASAGLSMSECSAKYKDAKAERSLNGMKWNDFRKSQCGAGAADDETVPSMDEANYTDEPERPVAKAPRGVKFPNAVSAKFSAETPAKARMRTCLEQYYANRDADTLNGLRWIQKGGGFYSLCNARLKNDS
jgi:hypothetical protein